MQPFKWTHWSIFSPPAKFQQSFSSFLFDACSLVCFHVIFFYFEISFCDFLNASSLNTGRFLSLLRCTISDISSTQIKLTVPPLYAKRTTCTTHIVVVIIIFEIFFIKSNNKNNAKPQKQIKRMNALTKFMNIFLCTHRERTWIERVKKN